MDLKLDAQTWTVIGPLDVDAAGFGRVYEVASPSGDTAVAKIVPKAAGAQRELLMGDSVEAARYRNVIPIIDSGEHEDSWVLVMPRAERSLAQYLHDAAGVLPLDETLRILEDIATALAEIDGAIVHRDLKPANILLHEGVWKLADFGIAKYSNASTAGSTRKSNFTAPYAAPEQWEFRHATSAVDVYAFGVLAYELVAGTKPFRGPDREDYREQHLREAAPALTVGTARLRILIEECLYKEPTVRPSPPAILARLQSAGKESQRTGVSKLAAFSQGEARRRALEHAEASAERERQELHDRKVSAAAQALAGIADLLRSEIFDNAPMAVFDITVGNAAPLFRVHLGEATLRFDRAQSVEGWDGPFTVLAYASISIDFGRPGRNWVGRSHSLWYGDPHEEGRFGWYELAFMSSPLSATRPQVEPFAGTPYELTQAFQQVIGTRQVAWPVSEVDRADCDEFIERWLGWLADAAGGSLSRPSSMPERPSHNSWRTE